MSVFRSHWAVIGAVAAVGFASGGFGLAHSATDSGSRPVTVTINPERVLDTRVDLGLTGRFLNDNPRDLQVTGSVPVASGGEMAVVPSDATAVLVNVTAVNPDSKGYLSLRPAGAVGIPTTSTVNFMPGAVEPNAATVDLGTGGMIQIYARTEMPDGSVHVLVDVVGYTIDHSHPELTARGAIANVIWVSASGGDFTTLSAALESITDASPLNRYLIRIGPGTFVERGTVMLKDYVDISGSGIMSTRVQAPENTLAMSGLKVHTTIQDLTVVSNGGLWLRQGDLSQAAGLDVSSSELELRRVAVIAIASIMDGMATALRADNTSTVVLDGVRLVADGFFAWGGYVTSASNVSVWVHGHSAGGLTVARALTDVTVQTTSETTATGVTALAASSMRNVDVSATTTTGPAVGVKILDGSPSLEGVVAVAKSATGISYGVHVSSASPTLSDVTATGDQGVYNESAASPTIRSSVLTGTVGSVTNDPTSSARIAHSMLDGAVEGPGFACVGAYAPSFVELTTTCR